MKFAWPSTKSTKFIYRVVRKAPLSKINYTKLRKLRNSKISRLVRLVIYNCVFVRLSLCGSAYYFKRSIEWTFLKPMARLQCHAFKNKKKRNHSINQVMKPGYERWLIYEQHCHDLDLCGNSFARYLEKCSTQIYSALYGDTMLVPMGSNVAKRQVFIGSCIW